MALTTSSWFFCCFYSFDSSLKDLSSFCGEVRASPAFSADLSLSFSRWSISVLREVIYATRVFSELKRLASRKETFFSRASHFSLSSSFLLWYLFLRFFNSVFKS